MALVINTGENLSGQLDKIPPEAHLWVYCGFDACTPHEILPAIKSRFDSDTEAAYRFCMASHAVALTMSLTGVPVNEAQIMASTASLEAKQKDLDSYINSMFIAFWGRGLNVRSPAQMADFFYFSEDGLQLTPHMKRTKLGSGVTTERKALEAISRQNYYTQPLINAILAVKDLQKRLEFLRRGVDDDRRVRCTFSPAGTETGRWSSNKNPWGRGGNFQNQNEEIRKIYVPDDDCIFVYADLKQAESYAVAYLSGDENYLAAVSSGDVHTAACRLAYPNLAWPGDGGQLDKEFSESYFFYRHFTLRDTFKRGGHATNYLGSAAEVARNIGVPDKVMEEFQVRYLNTFHKIPHWHKRVQSQLQSEGVLVTPLGFKRTFFGRLYDDSTLKEAIAFVPQSLIAHIFKIGLYRTWEAFEKPYINQKTRPVRLYADMHDGGLIGIRTALLDELAPKIIKLFQIPVRMPAGVMTIPVDFKVGWRWQKKEMLEWQPGVLSRLGPRPNISNAMLELNASDVA